MLVLDINEAEADLMLATLDPMAAMAGRDEERLSELLSTVSSDNDTVNALLQALASGYKPLTLGDYSEEYAGDESAGLDSQFEVIIVCDGESHQRELLTRLTEEGLICRSLIS